MAATILALAAHLSSSGEQLSDELLAAIDRAETDGLVVDIGQLHRFGSEELGAFILGGMRAAERRVPLTLVNIGREAMHVLLLSGLAPLFLGIVDVEAAA